VGAPGPVMLPAWVPPALNPTMSSSTPAVTPAAAAAVSAAAAAAASSFDALFQGLADGYCSPRHTMLCKPNPRFLSETLRPGGQYLPGPTLSLCPIRAAALATAW